MEVQEILSKVKEGTMSVEEAKRYLKRQPFEELGYAKLETQRKIPRIHSHYGVPKYGPVFQADYLPSGSSEPVSDPHLAM